MLRQPKSPGGASRCAIGCRAKVVAMLREFRVGLIEGRLLRVEPMKRWTGSGWVFGEVDRLGLGLEQVLHFVIYQAAQAGDLFEGTVVAGA